MTEPLQREIDELRRRIDADGLSRAESEEVWAAVQARAAKPLRLMVPAIAFATAVATVVVAVLVFRSRDEGWYRVVEGAACVKAGDELVVADGCGEPVLGIGRDRVQVAAGTRLTAEPRGVRLRRGRARFTIERRAQGEPAFEVAVSHGTVRVLGTVFTVEQGDAGGEVALESGRIEMRWDDGTPTAQLSAGERLAWPRPEPSSEPAVAPDELPDRREPPRRLDSDPRTVDAIMQKQLQLRGQRRYQDAVDLLDRASRRADLTKAQRERLSFELGNVLGLDGRDKEACAHWRRHVARFPASAKKAEVAKLLDGCSSK